MEAQRLRSQNLAQRGSGSGQRGGNQVSVAQKIGVVQEKAEHDRQVPLLLERIILLFQWPDEGIGQVRGAELLD